MVIVLKCFTSLCSRSHLKATFCPHENSPQGTWKEVEPLVEFDRDRKKLDVFLSRREKTLTIADIKVFMPFTINLDPFLRKVIKEEVQNLEQLGFSLASQAEQPQYSLTRRQAVELNRKMSEVAGTQAGLPVLPQYLANQPGLVWPYSQQPHPPPPHLPHVPHPPHPQLPQQPHYSSAGQEERSQKLLSRPVLPSELQGRVLSSFSLENVCLLLRSIEGVNTTMADTYCASILSNNINGQVLLHCEVTELRSVINMNFGDWELFMLVLSAMREDEESCPARQAVSQQPHLEPEITVTNSLSSSSHENVGDKSRARRKQSNIEKQVAMEEATVSGLLSTLNEEAKEDILLEEISTAREEAESSGVPLEESDYLYISHSSPGPRLSAGPDDPERGRARQSLELIWSAATSRAGSALDLLEMTKQAEPAVKRAVTASRAATVVSFTPVQSGSLEGEEEHHPWLSHTAPASPRETRRARLLTDPAGLESDPGQDPGLSKLSIFSSRSARSVRRTKKKPQESQEESDDTEQAGRLSRTSSRVKIDKLKRKVRNVLSSNEPGQLPMVQKAKPNHEEYHQFSQSQKTSRSSSFSSSVCLSDDSLSSPEQQTIAKRPDSEVARPALQNIFPPAREEEVEEQVRVMTAVLPDGSKMTASSAKKMFTIGDKTEQQ